MNPTVTDDEARDLLARLATAMSPPPVPLALVERQGGARRRTRRAVVASAAAVAILAGSGASVAVVRHSSTGPDRGPTTHEPGAAAVTREMRRFEGTWDLGVSNVAPDGQQITRQWPLLRITFSGDRFTTSDGAHTITGRFHASDPGSDRTSVFTTSDLTSTGGSRYRGPALPPLLETLRLANRSYHRDGRILVLGGHSRSTSAITMTLAPVGGFVGHLAGTVTSTAAANQPLGGRLLALVSADGLPEVRIRTDAQGRFDVQVSAGRYTIEYGGRACITSPKVLVRPGHVDRVDVTCSDY